MRGRKMLLESAQQQEKPKQKGRSSTQVRRRNECLMDRYYYYSAFTDKRYELIVETLSAEFFLSIHTIPDLIQDYARHITELKQKKPTVAYFSSRWPFMKW